MLSVFLNKSFSCALFKQSFGNLSKYRICLDIVEFTKMKNGNLKRRKNFPNGLILEKNIEKQKSCQGLNTIIDMVLGKILPEKSFRKRNLKALRLFKIRECNVSIPVSHLALIHQQFEQEIILN